MEEKGSIEKVTSLLPQGGGGDLREKIGELSGEAFMRPFFVVCDNGQSS